MSYEGSKMYLCQNGHLHARDCYDTAVKSCPDCGATLVWWCSIDQTNHSGVWPVLVEFWPVRLDMCECCGNVQQLEPARYFVPSNVGHLSAKPSVPTIEVKFRVWNSQTREWQEFSTIDEAINFLYW